MTVWYSFVRNSRSLFISLFLVLATCLNATAAQQPEYSVRDGENVRTLLFGTQDGDTYEFNIERATDSDREKYTYQAMLANPVLVAFSKKLREVAKTNPAKAVEMLVGAKNMLGSAAGMGQKFARGAWKFTTVDFPAETLGFYAAQFAIVLRKLAIQTAWDGPADPAALISFWHHVSSPAGIVGFYGFMVGSLATRQSLTGLVHLAATMNGLTVQTVPIAGQPKMMWQRDANGKVTRSLTKGVRLQAKVLNSAFVKQLQTSYAGSAAVKLGVKMNFGANITARALAGFILYFQKFLFQHATMGVGMMASTFIEELWHDEDVAACAEKSLKIEMLDENGKPVGTKLSHSTNRTCEKAYMKWTWSEKVWDFTPHFWSLSAAVVINSAAVMPAVNATGKAVKGGTGFTVKKVGGKRVYVTAIKYARIGFRTAGKVGSAAATYWPWGAGILVKGSKVFWSLFWLMGTAEVLESLFVTPTQVIRHSWKNLSEDVDAKLEEAVSKNWDAKDMKVAEIDPSCKKAAGWWSALINVGQTAFGFGCDTNNKAIAKDLLSSVKRRSTRMKKYRDMRLMPLNTAVSGWQTYTANMINVGFGALKAYPAIGAAANAENIAIVEEARKGILGTNQSKVAYGYTPGTNAHFYAGINVKGIESLEEGERNTNNVIRLTHKHIAENMANRVRVHLLEERGLNKIVEKTGFKEKFSKMRYHNRMVFLWKTLNTDLRQANEEDRKNARDIVTIKSEVGITPLGSTMFTNELLAQLAVYFYLASADVKIKLKDIPLIETLKKLDKEKVRKDLPQFFVDYKDEQNTRMNLVINGLRLLRYMLSTIPQNFPDSVPFRWIPEANFQGKHQVLDVYGKIYGEMMDEEKEAALDSKYRKENPFYSIWTEIGKPWPLEPGERFMLKVDRTLVDPTGSVRQGGMFSKTSEGVVTPTLTEHFVAGMACGHSYSLPSVMEKGNSWHYYISQPFRWILEQTGAIEDRSLSREINRQIDQQVKIDLQRHIKLGDYATAIGLIQKMRMNDEYEVVWGNLKGVWGLMEKFQPHRMTNGSFDACSQASKSMRGHEIHSADGDQKYYGLFDVIRHRLADRYKNKESFGKEQEQMAFAVGATYMSYKTKFNEIIEKNFFGPYNDDRFYKLNRENGSSRDPNRMKGLGWLQRYFKFWGEQYVNAMEWFYDVEVVRMDEVYKPKKRANTLTKAEIESIKQFLSKQGPLDTLEGSNQPLPPERVAARLLPYSATEYSAAGIRNNLMQEFIFLFKVLDALAVSYAQDTDNPEMQYHAYRRAKSGLRLQFADMLDSLNSASQLHTFNTHFAKIMKTFHGLAGYFNPTHAANPQAGYEEATKDETSMNKISAILISLENREKKEYKSRSISYVLDQMKDLMLEANKYHVLTETIKMPDQPMEMPAM